MNKKLILKHNDIALECEGYEMSDVLTLINAITGDAVTKEVKVSKLEAKPFIRKTETETVDLKEIGKTIKMPKLTSNFRCPDCGQGIMMKYISGETFTYLVRNIFSEKKSIHKVEVLELPTMITTDGDIDKEKVILIYKDLLKLLGESKMIIESDSDSGHCPVCNSINSVKKWINCGEDTLKNFDALILCDICGEEGDIVVTESGDCVLCENECARKIQA